MPLEDLLSIDLKKAFDSVNKEKVLRILEGRYTSAEEHHIVGLIRDLHGTSILEVGQLSFQADIGVV